MKNQEPGFIITLQKDPEIQPPVTVPDNPPAAPPEIRPGHDPEAPVHPPEIRPVKPSPEIAPK